MSTLKTTTLDGVYLKQEVRAVFNREPNGDQILILTIGGNTREPIRLAAKDKVRACWAVACDYFRAAMKVPPAGTQVTNRQRKIATAVQTPRIAADTADGPVRARRKRALPNKTLGGRGA